MMSIGSTQVVTETRVKYAYTISVRTRRVKGKTKRRKEKREDKKTKPIHQRKLQKAKLLCAKRTSRGKEKNGLLHLFKASQRVKDKDL